MIYTIGHTKSYLRYFREQVSTPKKKGRDLSQKSERYPNGYPGGSVWEKMEDAQSHLDRYNLTEYSVFGVDAEWGAQTVKNQNGEWHDLLVSSHLIILGHVGVINKQEAQ